MLLLAGLESHFSIQLTVDKGVVYVRSKPNMHVTQPWSEPVQLFPPLTHPETKPHDPNTEPEPAPLGEWTNLERVKETLSKFYSNRMRRVVTHIPADVSERELTTHTHTHTHTLVHMNTLTRAHIHSPTDMLTFLRNLDRTTVITPHWIDWERNPHR